MERRERLYAAACRSFSSTAREFLGVVNREAPSADALPAPPPAVGAFRADLMGASLSLDSPDLDPGAPWGDAQQPVFDVIAHGSVRVVCRPDLPWGRHSGYVGRSHPLYFCDAVTAGKDDWFETAFMTSPLLTPRAKGEPFDLGPAGAAARALCPGMADYQVAWPFTALVNGELEEFVDRWVGWFADAVEGTLARPSHMPERLVDGTWRQNAVSLVMPGWTYCSLSQRSTWLAPSIQSSSFGPRAF